ncbi:MAG: hypothetical protein R8P61_36960 [Bacteroidia bacterium]|nr:hypothetical protein [Bacteroidia bacterium]
MKEQENLSGCLWAIGLILFIPFILFMIPYIMQDWKIYQSRTTINNEFRLEYAESASSISLTNGSQIFVGNVKEAYWNKDTLLVSGKHECFMLIFGKTHYRDQMIPSGCYWLSKKLKSGSIEKYIANQK